MTDRSHPPRQALALPPDDPAPPPGDGTDPRPRVFDVHAFRDGRPDPASLVPGHGEAGEVIRRWECRCQGRPFLLATVDPSGRVNVKIRDRYLHITGGRIEATCPVCGGRHELDGAGAPERAARS